MAFPVNFYAFSKKRNSTAVPSSGATTINVTIKEPSSILTPELLISQSAMSSSSTPPTSFTYAYIAKFARYYFVNDWVYEGNMWRASLSVDPLATFRSRILTSSQYVTRASNEFNTSVSDVMFPATVSTTVEGGTWQPYAVTSMAQGIYVLGVINNEGTNTQGAVTYYAMSNAQMQAVKDILLSDAFINGTDLHNISSEQIEAPLLKAVFNPFQYIVSCKWFPWPFTSIDGTASSVKCGWWTLPNSPLVPLLKSEASTFYSNGQFSITAHPQASRGAYLNYAPYTERTLYFPPFGTIPLDTFVLPAGSYVQWQLRVDLISGRGILELYRSQYNNGTLVVGSMIHRAIAQIGVDIQLAQIGTDYIGAGVTALNSVSNIGSGIISGALTGYSGGGVLGGILGAVGNGITSIANGVYNTIQAASPQLATGGYNGSQIDYLTTAKCIYKFREIVDGDDDHVGRPLCATRTLSSLQSGNSGVGFVQISNPTISISALGQEREAIVNNMRSGMYLE